MTAREDGSVVDRLFPDVCRGDEAAFEAWMGAVEGPLRRSLAPWARAVDVESVVQETLLRVWDFAQDRGDALVGEDASLRWALGIARNVARNEARRFRRERPTRSGRLPEPPAAPPRPSDPALHRIIRRCLEALSPRPRQALQARIDAGPERDDASLARLLGMRRNTFLQNIVRARKQMAACLEENGAPLAEFLP